MALLAWSFLAWGLGAGDVTDREAALVLSANQAWDPQTEPIVAAAGADTSAYRWLNPVLGLLALPRDASSGLVTPFSARLASLGFWLATAALVGWRVGHKHGFAGASVCLLVLASSPAAFYASNLADFETLLALGVTFVLFAWGPSRVYEWILLAVATAGAGMIGLWLLPVPSELTPIEMAIVATALPWPIIAGLLALDRTVVRTLPASGDRVVRDGLAVAFTGAVVTLATQGQACGLGGLLVTIGASLCMGALWPSFASVYNCKRSPAAFGAWAVMWGAPAIALGASVLRIFSTYQFMERTQVVTVVALAAIALGVVIARRGERRLILAPVTATLLAAKVYFVLVYLPERDQFHSQKPWANAVAAALPAGEPVAIDWAVTPAFRFYLDRPTVRQNDTSHGIANHRIVQWGTEPSDETDNACVLGVVQRSNTENWVVLYSAQQVADHRSATRDAPGKK